MTLTTTPAASGVFDAIISRIVNRGLYTGSITANGGAFTLTRNDGTSWLDDGFLEGQLIQITGLSGATATYKINTSAKLAHGRPRRDHPDRQYAAERSGR
jgi:hypothetical protein